MNAIIRHPRQNTFRLVHEDARTMALKAILTAPDGYVATVKPPNRSLDQNARLHALLADISASKVEVCGEAARSVDDLKTIFVSAWMIETERSSDMVRGLHDEPVQLRRSTTTFSKAEMSELIEMVTAWAVQHGIRVRDVA